MSVGKKLRFEVFKRDRFTCQYCGAKAPDVALHCDHIEPKSKGGADDILNLIAACQGCNSGKGARRLDDAAVVEKRRAEAESLQDRAEQIEMMARWARSLVDLDDKARSEAEAFWCELSTWESLTEHGRKKLSKIIRKFGLGEVLTSMRIAEDKYDNPEDGFNKIGGICKTRQIERDDPVGAHLRHVMAILNKQGHHTNWAYKAEIRKAIEESGADQVRGYAARCTSWTDFISWCEKPAVDPED